MGENSAQDVMSQITPCLPLEGECQRSGVQEPSPPLHLHSQRSPSPPHSRTPNGFCSAGVVHVSPASSSEPQSPSPCQGEKSDLEPDAKTAARSGFEEVTASSSCRQGSQGCKCLLADSPAGCLLQAEDRGVRASSLNCEDHPPSQTGGKGGGDPTELGENPSLCSTPAAVLPLSNQDQECADSSSAGQQLVSLLHSLQNGAGPQRGHQHHHQPPPVLNVNDVTILLGDSSKISERQADVLTALLLENADLETSDPAVKGKGKGQSKALHAMDTHAASDARIRNKTPNNADHHGLAEEAGESQNGKEVEEEDDDEEAGEEEEGQEDEKNEDEDDHDEEHVQRAYRAADVDQGWAWVVLVSAFLGMTIFGTFTFSIGIFQAEILQVMEPDVQKTSWVGATHFSTLCMMGPFAGLIKNKLGSRKTVLLSSVIICFGMIAASLSVNVIQLILTYGVITGIGTGMALNPMYVCVSFYFERYRGFASGVIAAGAGAGMFVGGPIIRQLMEAYGLSGTFLIWGAVGLNIGVAGMVMRPSSLERRRERGEMEEAVVVKRMGWMDPAMLASVSTLPSAGGYWGSVLGLSSFMVREKEPDTLTLQQSQNLLDMPDIHDAIRSYSELSALSPEAMETAFRSTWLTRNFKSSQLSVGDSLDSASTGRRQFSPRLFRRNSRPEDPEKGREAEETPSLQQEEFCLPKARCRGNCLASLDLFRILSNPGFALYMFSASLWVFGESIIYAYLPTYAQAQGSSPFQSATLITAVGFTSTFSRLVMGFVASNPAIGPDLMHVGMLGLCGLFTLTFPLYSASFSGQLAFAALYGLYSGGLASVINIVILSLMGVQHIALAFGLICFGQGIASLAGPPLSGFIVHAGGSYDHVFIFSGSLLLLAGFSGFFMVLFKPPPPPSPQPRDDVVEEDKAGEIIPPVRIRMKGDNSHT